MERITATQALSAGIQIFKRHFILLAGIGLGIAALTLLGQRLPVPLEPPLGTVIVSLLLMWPLQAGLDFVSLRLVRDGSAGLRDLSVVLRCWPALLVLSGIRYGLSSISSIFISTGEAPLGLAPFLWLPLSLVGLILSLVFAFAPILILDRKNALASQEEATLGSALRLSAQLTRGRKGTLFVIPLLAGIPLLVIGILGALITGTGPSGLTGNITYLVVFYSIGGLFCTPWISASTMAVFDQAVSEHPNDAEPIEYEVLGSDDAD